MDAPVPYILEYMKLLWQSYVYMFGASSTSPDMYSTGTRTPRQEIV